jgi:peptide/nickel transport system substrate-binding protein
VRPSVSSGTNLAPVAKGQRPTLVSQDGFREAISLAVDRREFANEVYLGAAEPSAAPVPPSVKEWTTDLDAGRYDPARAAAKLEELGLVDRDKDGVREDALGRPARFSILVGAGITPSEKGAQFVRDSLARIGVAVDVVPLDINAVMGRWRESRYDAIYHRVSQTDTDPAAGSTVLPRLRSDLKAAPSAPATSTTSYGPRDWNARAIARAASDGPSRSRA